MLCGLRLDGGSVHTEFIHIYVEFIYKTVCKFFGGGILFACPRNNLVINVCEVSNIGDFITEITQVAYYHVKGQC